MGAPPPLPFRERNKPAPRPKLAPPPLAALLLLCLTFHPAAAQTAGGASANPLTGENNVALGQGTLQHIQGGSNGNTAVGVYALNTLTTGTSNTALGYNAGQAITTGTDNTLVGFKSGKGVTGNYNIILGEDPSSAITTGSSNILIGNSLSNVTNTSNTQLDIGDLIMGSISSSAPEVGIGTKTYQGQGLTVSGKVWATQFEMTSDARLKTDIRPLVDSLSRIEQVKGVTFEWKPPESRTLGKGMSLPLNQPQMGVLAQDVEAAFPQAVATGPDGLKTVNYESLVAPLIEAVKAQQEEIRRLTPLVEEVGAQQEEIKRLELRLDAQKREIDDLKSRSPHTQPASFHPDSQPSP